MLKNFTVSNFGSITNPVTLSLEPNEKVVQDENETFLPVTMILGANCSGKSTLIEAMTLSQNLILASSYIGVEDDLHLEAMETYSESDLNTCESLFKDKSSAFEWEIEIKEKNCIYCFEATKEKIVKEYLYVCENGEYSMIFQRYKEKYAFTKNGVGGYSKIEGDSKILFLLLLADQKEPTCVEIVNYFQNGLEIVGGYYLSHFFKFAYGTQKPQIVEDVKEVDLPIRWDDEKKFYQQCWESNGTERFLALAVFVREALKDGKTLIVDDLEEEMHPFLTQWILNKFLDPEENPKQAQLIFTTRTPWITQLVPLKQDQIVFTNQSRGERPMEVYKLSDFEPIPQGDFIKSYFEGRYDAIPRII